MRLPPHPGLLPQEKEKRTQRLAANLRLDWCWRLVKPECVQSDVLSLGRTQVREDKHHHFYRAAADRSVVRSFSNRIRLFHQRQQEAGDVIIFAVAAVELDFRIEAQEGRRHAQAEAKCGFGMG